MRSVPFSLILALSIFSVLLSGCPRSQRGSVETCTPGESLLIGCDGTQSGPTCTGDPTLTICDASIVAVPENCTRSGSYLAYSDDEGSGLCPLLTTVCPTSGRISINPDPFGRSSTSWSCAYVVDHGTVGP